MMLLRIGKRSTVVLGKYLATVIASVVSILATLVTCIVSYYLFAASSAMGTGTFASTMEGLSSLAVCGTIGGGCVEADILRRALLMIRNEETKPQICHIDMTGIDVEDEGMVCGGVIDVL